MDERKVYVVCSDGQPFAVCIGAGQASREAGKAALNALAGGSPEAFTIRTARWLEPDAMPSDAGPMVNPEATT